MKHTGPQLKHSILTHITSQPTTDCPTTVAARHGASVSIRTLQRWNRQWKRNVASLTRKQGSGRPRTLTPKQVRKHIQTPIRKANEKPRLIHYPELVNVVQSKTQKKVSYRTIARYAKEQLNTHQVRVVKRTHAECKYTHSIHNHV